MTGPAQVPDTPAVTIHAAVGPSEEPMLTTAAALLAECIRSGGGIAGDVRLTVAHGVRSDFLSPCGPEIPAELHREHLVPPSVRTYGGPLYQTGPRIVVLSLSTDVLSPALRRREAGYLFFPLPGWQADWTAAQRGWVAEHFTEEPPLDPVEAAGHWRALCASLLESAGTSVFLCNVFRHVPGTGHQYYQGPESLRERILKFNLLATEVSQDTGAFVVDLDCALADVGARALRSDYRHTGAAAAAAGANALVTTLFRAGLDDYLPPEVQERAAAHLEARRADVRWFSLQMYKAEVDWTVSRSRTLSGELRRNNPEGVRRLGEFLLLRACELEQATLPGNLPLHRRLLAAIRETGAGYLDMARALLGGDDAEGLRAHKRIENGNEQFGQCWEAFVEFYQGNADRAG